MNVLFTNIVMAGRSGTEIFAMQLMREFRRRDVNVALYSPSIGRTGEALRSEGLLVYDQIRDMSFIPDVIHGHHLGPTLTALTAHPNAAAIFVSHSVEAEYDVFPVHPRVYRYCAVSKFIRAQRSTAEIPEESVSIVKNAVDTEHYVARDKPRERACSALIVAKLAGGSCLIERACQRFGISVTTIGVAHRHVVDNLKDLFERHDIVFASGRSALEALACGCRVVLTDGTRFAGLITSDNVRRYSEGNFGIFLMNQPISAEIVQDALQSVHDIDTDQIVRYIHAHHSLSAQADMLYELYQEAARSVARRETEPVLTASLIEAYIPSFSDRPWQRLARYVASGTLASDVTAQQHAMQRHYAMPDADLLVPVTRGEHNVPSSHRMLGWLTTGWWLTEPWGRWSKAEALFEAQFDRDVSNITLKYRVIDIVSIHCVDFVEIYLDGSRRIPAWQRIVEPSDDTVLESFDVSELATGGQHAKLSLFCKYATSPVSLGLNHDGRLIGIGLVSLTAT